MITLLLIATTVLTVYTAAMFMIFRKVPESYSETFYSLNKIRNNLGFLFPVTIFIVAVTAMPVWFEVGDFLESNFTFLAFFAVCGLITVSVSPYFKESQRDSGRPLLDLLYRATHGQGLAHTIGALTAMIATVTWAAINSMMVPFWVLTGCALVSFLATRTWKCVTFWIEIVIFYGILFVLWGQVFIILDLLR